jgi:hypothetical protein
MKRFTTLIIGAVLATAALTSCGSDSKSGSSTSAYCARIKAYKDKSNEFNSVFSATPDAAKVEEAYTTMQSMLHDLNNGAPAEIKADVAAMNTAIDKVVVILSKYEWDISAVAVAPEFAELQTELDGTEMQASSDRLETYSTTTCGIPSDTTSP